MTLYSYVLTTLAVCYTLLTSGCVPYGIYPTHPLAEPAMARLINGDETLAQEALVELKNLGAGAMPTIVERYSDVPPERRLQLVDVVVQIGAPKTLVVELFRAAAHDPIPAVRHLAATRATKLPELADDLKGILVEQLEDSHPEVRAAALTSLGNLPGPPEPSSQMLLALLNDKHVLVSAAAATIAVRRREPYIQAAARATLPRLVGGLQDVRPSTRASVLHAIGQFGIIAAPAVAPVKAVLTSDPVAEVRLQAALALLRIGTPEAIAATQGPLAKLAKDPNPLVKKAAQRALERK